jgi:hypothetical protein
MDEEARMSEESTPQQTPEPAPLVLEDGSIVFEEFEEGDARRGPYSFDERAHAAACVLAPKRWHNIKRDVDWFAVRLQFGRGLTGVELAKRFGIGDSTISGRQRDEGWKPAMSVRDRRRLARLVWLGGLVRGVGDDPGHRDVLKAWSEWRDLEEVVLPTFEPLDRMGAPRTATFNQGKFDDVHHGAADPKQGERLAIRRKLDDLIARMERDVVRRNARTEGEVAADVAGHPGGSAEPAPGREGVERVGASGADSA